MWSRWQNAVYDSRPPDAMMTALGVTTTDAEVIVASDSASHGGFGEGGGASGGGGGRDGGAEGKGGEGAHPLPGTMSFSGGLRLG